MPGVASGSPFKTIDSREAIIYVAQVANNTAPGSRVTPVTVTNSGAATAGAGVTLTIGSITPAIPMKVGQYLVFKDSSGSYLAKVATEFTTGTSLVVDIDEDIPDGAAAVFPVPVELVTTHSLPTSTAVNNVSTYDHTGQGEVSRGDTTRSVTFSALKSYYSSGQQTLNYCLQNEKDVYFEVHDPNPDSDVFTTNPPIRWGVGVLSDGSETGNNGEKISVDYTLNISGAIGEVAPA